MTVHVTNLKSLVPIVPLTLAASIASNVVASTPIAADTSPSAGKPADQLADDEDPMRVFRAPLLREGSAIVEALASMERDSATGWWVLVLDQQEAARSTAREGGAVARLVPATTTPDVPPIRLFMLPCTRVSEMERILEATGGGDQHVQFKVSGRIYVFRDHNYVLPSHAVIVAADRPEPEPESPPEQPANDPPSPQPAAQSAPEDDDSVDAIMRALEADTGPIARSSAAAMSNQVQGGSNNATSASAATSLMQENSVLVNRRGRITRDRSGGWLLVLDADATGLADPPLKLMPCMLLEDIQTYAQRDGGQSSIIVTGQVYVYNGQGHLMPTVYRIPRESSRLTP